MKRFAIILSGFLCLMWAGLALAGQTIRMGNSGSGAILLSQDRSGLLMRVDIQSIELQQVVTRGGDFTALAVPGFARSQMIGEPNVPTANRILAIPFGCELQVEIIESDIEEISLADYGFTQPVIPVQPSLSKSQNPEDVPFEYRREVYNRDGYYALPLGTVSEIGVMRALNLGIVSVAPIQYDAVSNKIRIYKSITLRINYLHPDWSKTEEMRRKYYSPFFEPVYSQIFNYEPLPSIALDDLVRYPVKFVIVADRMFESQLQPFIEWKIMKGFNVITAYTDDIGPSNSAIKAYLRELYENGEPDDPAPSFILLVGDDQQISAFQYSGHISDLDFGEYTGDHIPEVYYGRFSAQNEAQLQPQIDKTMEYEQYMIADPDFLNNVTLIAGVDPNFAPTHGNGQINYGTNNYFNEDHGLYSNTWLYPRSDEPGASAEIVQTVNDGLSLINYTAHGSHEGWADPSFEIGQINNLTNDGMYPLSIGNCCLTNTFGDDYSSPCAGERWLQGENKGAIGYIGASDNSYWDEDYWWGVGFKNVIPEGPPYDPLHLGAYDGVFHDHGEPFEQHYVTNDAVLFCGNMAVQESNSSLKHYYWEIYHLMGDPSVMTYLGVPETNSVDHPEVIILGEGNITVYADPYSYVGLSKDGVLHGAVLVGESGSANLEFAPFSVPGSADFVVTAQNKQPFVDVIPVIAPSGPYVVVDSVMIDDSNGNNNGIIDFGENILLGMTLQNVGPDPAESVWVNLNIDIEDPYISMADTIQNFGHIEGNFGSVTVPGAFSFNVAENVPDGYDFDFTAMIYSLDGYWESPVTLTAHAPVLAFSDVYVDDQSGGNGNGIFEAGETANLTVTLHNGGGSDGMNVAGTITSSDEYVTIDDGSGEFGNIEAGADGDNSGDTFVITAGDDLPPGHAVLFDLAVTADGGYSADLQFEVKAIESFEYNDGGWTGEGDWQWGEPTSGPGSAYDGTKVWATNLSGQYGNDADEYLLTGFYTVQNENASFSFYHWYNMESGWDGGNVAVSTDGGYSWELLTPESGYPDPDVTGLDGEPGFSGQSANWEEVNIALGDYVGEAVRLRFRLGTDGSITRDGWYIDAVTVSGARGWQGEPDIAVNPMSFNVEVAQGGSTQHNLNIANEGSGLLAYAIRPVTVGRRLRGDDPPDIDPLRQDPNWGKYIEHARNGDRLTVTYNGPKIESPDEPSDPQIILDTGGPDEFGYMWIDSDEPGGPVFDWVDISGIGQPLTFSDDQNQGPFDFGFEMPFYDNFFNSIRICSNGWLSFTSTVTTYSNSSIPSSSDPNNLVAPFWDDLNPSNGGTIYFYTNEVDSAIVAWEGVPHYPSDGSYTFEAIFTSEGDITFQYMSMQGTLNSCTVGIENADGSIGLQAVYNSNYIADGLAVKFMIPTFWLLVDPMSGMNPPGESSDFTVTFDASELDLGIYNGYLRIASNDPDEATVAVECTLSVVEQTGLEEGTADIPRSYSLGQNYPNPFNPTTNIQFGLPESREVTLKIYDLLGREVRTLLNQTLQAGVHVVEFDGSGLSSGVYFYRLTAGDFVRTRRMVILK